MVTSLILSTLLATAGPYDAYCSATARMDAATIIAREAGVPLDKVLSTLDDPKADPEARRYLRTSVLEIYRQGRNGVPFDEADFISRNTAGCIIRLENEAAAKSPEPPSIPAGVPLPEPCTRPLRTECVAIKIRNLGVK